MPKRKDADDTNVTDLPTAQTPEGRREAAELERRKFIGAIAGAQARAERLPRGLLKVLPFAVANLMMVDVLNGKIKVRTAGEAAQIAKIALEMGRLEMGDSTVAEPVTAEERKQKVAEATLLMDELKKRREILEKEMDDVPGATAPAGSAESATA